MTEKRLITLMLTLFQFQLLQRPTTSREIRIGALIPWNGTWPIGPRMASALLVAFDTIQNQLNLLPDYNLTYDWRDSECDTGATLRSMADLHANKPAIHAFIGPACSVGCMPGGYLAAHWDNPMISFGCGESTLSDKDEYPTFVRTVGTYAQTGKFFLKIMEKYNWNRVAIVSSTESLWSQVASFVKNEIDNAKSKGYIVSYFHVFSPGVTTDEQFKNMFISARKVAHVFILVGYGSSIRQIMLNLHDLDMITSQYAYFTFEIAPENCKGKDGRDEDACEAFEGLMDIANYIPATQEYRRFEDKVRQKMPEFAGLGYRMRPDDKVHMYAGFLHDAVVLYALAVHDHLQHGGNFTNGKALIKFMTNRSFEGVSGQVFIDGNGDRALSLQMKNFHSGKMDRVANYFRHSGKLEFMNVTTVWPGGSVTAPKGRPDCGFDNEFCLPPVVWKIALYVLLAFIALIVCMVALLLYYRRKAFEASLQSQQWKVSSADVKFTKNPLERRSVVRDKLKPSWYI